MNDFAEQLLEWHDENARELPWRGETDPYRIWISEIMLQQTRAETVKGYYARFLAEFPTVRQLADASEDRVLKLWEGLGYYSRARNLMAAAKIISDEYGGQLPRSRAELKKLPGIGEYVSGAVASIAFGLREPALDGNQARVLTRIWDLPEIVKTPAQLYDRALQLVPQQRPGDYNQAMMGLGALICLPKNPRCDQCPVERFCLARANGTQEQRPVKPEKPAQKTVPVMLALVCDEHGLLMRKRGEGMLRGMWEYPNFEGARRRDELEEALHEVGIRASYLKKLPEYRHVFTHRIWQIQGCLYRLRDFSLEGGFVKIPWSEYFQLAVPAAFAPYSQAARELAIQALAE